MKLSDKTARQMFQEIKDSPPNARFGFGRKPALINIDLQNQYTCPEEFSTAYGSPEQIEHVNALTSLFREKGLPIIWTYVAYMDSGADCGVWGTRSDTPNSLQNIKVGSLRAELDDRLDVDRQNDVIVLKRMASAFHETHIPSLLVWHGCDTIVVTGGSTSGCVRATVVDGLSSGYRMIVPEECVADRHESPHFANLYDMAAKYADVLPVAEVMEHLKAYAAE